MSRTTKTTTTGNRPLPVATTATPDTSDTPPVTAETRVHDALRDNPGTTTAKLALAAGVGRSTASKILARWATESTVIRTAGKDQRTPVTWSIHDTTDTTGNDDDTPDTGVSAPGDDDPKIPDTDSDPDAVGDVDTTEADREGIPAEAAPDDSAAASGDGNTTPTDPPSSWTDAESADTAPAETAPSDTETPAQNTTDGDDASPEQDIAPDDTGTTTAVAQLPTVDPDADQGAEPSPQGAPAATTAKEPQKDRLPKGGLYELVKTYLAEHPDDNFGPAKIGTDLGRSGGAVSNALDKLVNDGHAIKICEAPKRFAYKTDTTDVE